MNSIRLWRGCLLPTVVIWIVVCRPASGELLQPMSPQAAASTVTGPAVGAYGMESPEPAGPPLPDEGPRVEGGLHEQGILDLTWQEGQAAYKKAAWGEAKRLFEKLSRDYPKSAYIPGALAFLAEIALRDDASVRDRASAIQIYKTVVRDYPDSPNGRRAQWRIADLYLERGWLPEAQASYERSMGQSRQYPDDHNRAMLGLGYTFMAMQKWRDAEHTFMTLRKRSEQSLLSRYAAVGLAHAMYRQGRMMEAHAFYELSYRGWPVLFRRDPQAIYRYAMTQMAIHRDASAQEVLLLLYNLYPRDEHAPDALLQVAEHMAMTSQLSQAQFFYALIPSLYPNSTHSAMATMRMAVLRVEHMAQTDVNRVDVTVRAMMHNVSMPDLTGEAYRTLLQGIVAQLSNSPMGNEALVHLGKYYERTSETEQAMQAYKEAVQRAVHADNPWAVQASGRFSTLLTPVIDEAVKSHDDLAVVSLFHRYGPSAERVYAQSPLMLDIAEAHRRLGFALEAGRLYQHLTRVKDVSVLETALVGLGKSYLDQQDPHAARKVLERYRFQFQDGRYESEVLHLLVGAMRRQEDLQGMLRLCRQWLIHHPKHRDRSYMYLQLAETLRRLEKFEESVAAYEAAFNAGGQPSIDTILAYAGTLSRMNLHERAIAAYQAALDQAPTVRQAEWIHLQAAKHWNALKQYDRATVSLAEVGDTDDPLINRFTTAFKASVQAARRPSEEEGL